MNSVERTLRTLEHQIPDRVPVDLHNFLVTARMMCASSYADFFRDGEAMAEGQILAWRRFGHDVLLVENGTAALAEACGVQVQYQADSAPVAKEPAISSLDQVDALQVPDPYRNPLLSELLRRRASSPKRLATKLLSSDGQTKDLLAWPARSEA